MYVKIVCLTFILLQFVYQVPAECGVKRLPRSSDDPSEKLQSQVEPQISEDPMVPMASANLLTAQDSIFSKLRSDLKRTLGTQPLNPVIGLNLDQLIIPNAKPKMPKLDINELRSPLTNVANKLPRINNVPIVTLNRAQKFANMQDLSKALEDIFDKPSPNLGNKLALPRLNNVPKPKLSFAERSRQLSNNLKNIVKNPSPQEIVNNALNEIILSRRKGQDLFSSPSNTVANETPETIEEELQQETETIEEESQQETETIEDELQQETETVEEELQQETEKPQGTAEKMRKSLEEKLADIKSKISQLKTSPNAENAEDVVSNTNVAAQDIPEDNAESKSSLPERVKLLREKLISNLKRRMEKEISQ